MSICPRLLALYAYLKLMGACDTAACIFHDNWAPNYAQVVAALNLVCSDADEFVSIHIMWTWIPDDRARKTALALLEEFMWRDYTRNMSESARQQIWCLYYEVPASADRLPW